MRNFYGLHCAPNGLFVIHTNVRRYNSGYLDTPGNFIYITFADPDKLSHSFFQTFTKTLI